MHYARLFSQPLISTPSFCWIVLCDRSQLLVVPALNYQGETVLISCPWKLVLRLYNTATHKVEEFKPINPDKVGMYVCGLTVYNDMHLGHARTYISFDVIRRWLEYSGYEVTFVQNHTDIDDKIIQKANEEDSTTEEIASRYIERTTEDLEKLQVRPPTFMPKATDFIKEMIEIVSDYKFHRVNFLFSPVLSLSVQG